MQVQGTALIDRPSVAAPAPAPAGTVHDLSITELAVALCASGVSLARIRAAGPSLLTEWAADGLADLGIELVWWYGWRTTYIHTHDSYAASLAGRSELQRMWRRSSHRAVQTYTDAAYRMTSCARTLPPRLMINVDVPAAEPGCYWRYRVSVRDLEFAKRYPDRALTCPHLTGLLMAHMLAD